MSIKYKPVAKIIGPKKERLYYPSIVKSRYDFVDTKEIAREITELSSIDSGSVLCALDVLGKVMHRYFKDGKTVKLDGLGSFYPTLDCKGTGVDSPEKVNAKQIKKVNVAYIPEYTKNNKRKHICSLTKDIDFERSNLYPWPVTPRDKNK